MVPTAPVVRMLLALAVVLAGVATVVPVVAAQETAGSSETPSCLGDGGYHLGIGTEGPHIDVTLHLSLLSDPTDPGTLGMQARGSTGEHEIISLQTGVLFGANVSATESLDDNESISVEFEENESISVSPDEDDSLLDELFSSFAVAFHYRFQLPMLEVVPGMDFTYEIDEPPITGPIRVVEC